jgi:hypothetical protein
VDDFTLDGGIITVGSMTVSQEVLGQVSGNQLVMTFTPITELFSEGIIVFETPIYTSGIYNHELEQVVDEFYFGDEDFTCSSESFTSFTYEYQFNF